MVSAEEAQATSGKSEANAAPPLIMTKIQVPRRRADVLPRQRLLSYIHSHLDRKLILISAPAGYGKTTLLSEFASESDLPVCWLTLDQFDRDLRTFLDYFIASINRRFPTCGERTRTMLSSIQDPSKNLYPIVATLVQEIYDAIPEYFVIILDDHQTIEDQGTINEFIDLFATYSDENCHLIIASRTLPALPNLSLLIARRQAAGLSIDELRFTTEEIQALAAQNYGMKVSREQAESLSHSTGGWITGLLLLAAPQWRAQDAASPGDGLMQFDLYTYFLQQVLEQQPAKLRSFLLESSVLDELNPEACSQVLKNKDAFELLEQVRLRNLFVIEYVGDFERLRYHDLFRDFLQTHLRREDPVRYRELVLQAAEVYTALGEWERAINRYLTVQMYQPAADLIENIASQLYSSGRWDSLADWVDALPPRFIDSMPNIHWQRGIIDTERGDYAQAFAHFNQAERVFMRAGDNTGVARIQATKGPLMRFQGRYKEAIECSQQALALVGSATLDERATQALAYKNIGLCHMRLGHLKRGRQALHQALNLYVELSKPYEIGMAYHDLGLAYELAGELAASIEHYQASLRYWQELGSPSPWANTLNGLGVVYLLQGKYDQASEILGEALEKARLAKDQRIEAYILSSLGDLQRDLGAYQRAQDAYEGALEIAYRAHIGLIATYALDGLGNLHRLQGDLPQAESRLGQALEHAQEHQSAYELGLCNISLGILANQQGHLPQAASTLDQAIETLEQAGFQHQLARAYLHRAQTAYLSSDRAKALDFLTHSLQLAQAVGFDQFLVIDGEALMPLLEYSQDQIADPGRLVELISRIQAHRLRVAQKPEPRIQVPQKHTITIYAFGQPLVMLDDQTVGWEVTKSRDLFFLLLHHPRGLSRDQIGAHFWPDHTPERLEAVFRSTLYRLRRDIFKDCVRYEDGLYQFNRANLHWYDVETFEEHLTQAEAALNPDQVFQHLESALSLYKGDFLQGVYADWTVLERERLRGRYLAALETLAGLYAAKRRLHNAIELYQRLLSEDPFQEAAHRELMRCYYRLGDRAAAIRQYQVCVDMLRDELGLDPTQEIQELYMQIIR